MEGLTQEQIHSEAQALYRAEKDHSALRPFTKKYPKIDTDEAYKIQLALIEDEKKSRWGEGGGKENWPDQQGYAKDAQRRSARLRPHSRQHGVARRRGVSGQ